MGSRGTSADRPLVWGLLTCLIAAVTAFTGYSVGGSVGGGGATKAVAQPKPVAAPALLRLDRVYADGRAEGFRLAEDRAFVRRTKRDTVRAYAYEAYCYARRHDARVARRFLWWLLRQVPAEPAVAGALLGSCVPAGALERVLGAARQAGAALRRASRRGRQSASTWLKREGHGR